MLNQSTTLGADGLRAIARRKHREALTGARYWRTPIRYGDAYAIRGVCRADAARWLERAAAARFVYANAQRMASL